MPPPRRAGVRTAPDPLLRVIAWSAVILASALPTIIWRESGHGRAPWLMTARCVMLAVAAIVVLPFPRLRVLSRFLFALAAMRIGWHFVAPWIQGTDLIRR